MKWKQLLTNVTSIFKPKKEEDAPSPVSALDQEIKEVMNVKEEKKGIRLAGQTVFNEEQKLAVVKMIAHGWTRTEILDELKNAYGIKVSVQTIRNYAEADKWKPILKKMRDEYVSSTTEVAGSHKRVRLERAERMYDKAAAKGDIKFGLLSIEQQRKEFDKHEYNSFNILNQQYNYMSDEEVEERKNLILSKLNKKKELKNGNGRVESETGK